VPDELIYCPACNHRLRLPADLLGQSVECPQCHAHFAAPGGSSAPVVRPAPQVAPASGPSYADDSEARVHRGRGMLTAPAVCLLIVAVLSGLLNFFLLAFGVSVESDPAEFRDQLQAHMARNPNLTPEQRRTLEQLDKNPEQLAWWCEIIGGGSVAAAALTALGAIAMLARRMYWLALLGALAALNPIDCCCVDVNIPFAIWALIVLLSADGRAAFR
jgi:NADH:ubiquinone oxidoreductase subunit 5 (subunit L)/multisubunit Na+/H+ antiporter MnhA subunit